MNQEEDFLKTFALMLVLWSSISYSSLGWWHRFWSLDSVLISDVVSSLVSFLAIDTCFEHRDLLCCLYSEVWPGSGLNLLKRQIFWNDYHYHVWFSFPTWNMIRRNFVVINISLWPRNSFFGQGNLSVSEGYILTYLDSDTVCFGAGTSTQFWLWNGKLFPGNRNPRKYVEIGFYKEHAFSNLHRRKLTTAHHKNKPMDFKLKFSLSILCLLVTKCAICQPLCG